MSLTQNKEIATKLNNIATKAINNTIIPILSKSCISVGKFNVTQNNGKFYVNHKKQTLYNTHTKMAALIIAGLLNKQNERKDITRILQADLDLFACKNDLEIFKYHYNIAIKSKNYSKEGIMLARFEQTNSKYEYAKNLLKQSYSKLF